MKCALRLNDFWWFRKEPEVWSLIVINYVPKYDVEKISADQVNIFQRSGFTSFFLISSLRQKQAWKITPKLTVVRVEHDNCFVIQIKDELYWKSKNRSLLWDFFRFYFCADLD